METLAIKSPADLLSFIGHTLGFWPQESLVWLVHALNASGGDSYRLLSRRSCFMLFDEAGVETACHREAVFDHALRIGGQLRNTRPGRAARVH